MDPQVGAGAAGMGTPIPIDITKLDAIKCPKCEGEFFITLQEFRRLSALQSPSGKTELIPMQYVACSKCHTIIDVKDDGEVVEMNPHSSIIT
ncbi:MAG: hypothetical protein KAS32_29230 [Candidatus Peribacteraceae bacterium]|nr:hypothetical protein [Candidatus Peribacteraceae bacterium]